MKIAIGKSSLIMVGGYSNNVSMFVDYVESPEKRFAAPQDESEETYDYKLEKI